MRVSNQAHLDRPWRIHDLVRDFRLEDVWDLPAVSGSAADFDALVALATGGDPARTSSLPSRVLWRARDVLGRWFDLGSVSDPADVATGLPVPGATATSLAPRLPDDLRGTVDGLRFEHLPFVPLYRTADELAAEISNRTVHGVMHLGWVPDGDGTFHEQMAVYVKPRGRLGSAYLTLIKPFRHLVVYPALERQLARTWAQRRG